MATKTVAELELSLNDFRQAFVALLSATRGSRARVVFGFDGQDLTLSRAGIVCKAPAKGIWVGTATFSDRHLLQKVNLLKSDVDPVHLRVVGSQLLIGQFVVECAWKFEE